MPRRTLKKYDLPESTEDQQYIALLKEINILIKKTLRNGKGNNCLLVLSSKKQSQISALLTKHCTDVFYIHALVSLIQPCMQSLGY